MDLLSRYKRHDDLIQHGAILELGEGASAHIARMHDSNPQYKKVTEQLARQRQYELDNLKGQKKNTAYAEIAEEAFAQVCITKLTNIRIGGDVIEADAIGIARIRSETPEFFQKMMQFAMDDSNYVGSFNEENSVKN